MLVIVFTLLLVSVAFYAFACGGRDERRTAGIFLGSALASFLVTAFARNNYVSIQWLTWAVDAAALVALLAVAIRSPAEWPAWMVAMQAIDVASHAARIFNPGVMNWVYFALTALWAFPMLAVLAWATRRQQRRRRDPNVMPLSPSSWMRSFFRSLKY